MSSKDRIVTWESWTLAGVCLADLLSTLFWVSYRHAAEGNPIMSWYLEHGGVVAFIAAKTTLVTIPLFIAEWARRTHPEFVRSALRLGIVAYLVFYGMGVAHVNRTDELDRIAREANTPSRAIPVAQIDR